MNEKPIERMNYFNGQRLEADDFKTEQEYHVRVRRWLNKSLYSAGIARGLEVRPDPGNPQQVIVSPGLALDNEGREIILLDEERISVVGRKSEKEGLVEGNYLYIQYREETRAEESDDCTPRRNGKKNGQLAWGGPSRVRAKPVLGWSNAFPQESTGKVVLAQVELDPNCNLRHVYAYPRRYIAPASNQLVHQYALEGERHIDANSVGRIYFHIRGHQPNAVTLYLRAEKFSSLYYTEMGQHKHTGVDAPTDGPILDTVRHKYSHQHTNNANGLVANNETNAAGQIGHNHFFSGRMWPFPDTQVLDGQDKFGLAVTQGPPNPKPSQDILNDIQGRIYQGEHSHPISGAIDPETPDLFHTHISTASMEPAGVTDPSPPAYSAHSGSPLTYLDNLQVYIGKVATDGRRSESGPHNNYTALILNHLKNAQPGIYGTKTKLGEGNGSEDDPLATFGTGPIPLDSLSNNLVFSEGEYYIDVVVNSGGGRILYNLYVE